MGRLPRHHRDVKTWNIFWRPGIPELKLNRLICSWNSGWVWQTLSSGHVSSCYHSPWEFTGVTFPTPRFLPGVSPFKKMALAPKKFRLGLSHPLRPGNSHVESPGSRRCEKTLSTRQTPAPRLQRVRQCSRPPRHALRWSRDVLCQAPEFFWKKNTFLENQHGFGKPWGDVISWKQFLRNDCWWMIYIVFQKRFRLRQKSWNL